VHGRYKPSVYVVTVSSRVHISNTFKIISESLILCVLFPKSLDGQHVEHVMNCVKDIIVLDNLRYFSQTTSRDVRAALTAVPV